LSFGEKALKGEARSVLLSLLLGGSFGFSQGARAALFVCDADFDAKTLLMVGAALVGEDIVGLAGSCGLEVLLQGGFVVADSSAEGVPGLEGEVKIGKGGLDDVLFDEGARHGQTTVEVESGDDRFEGVGEESGLSAAAALLFTATEKKERAEVDARGDLAKMTTADERGAETGEFAFARGWKAAEERFGDCEAKDGVTDELELFVVGGWIGEGLGVGFVGEGAVSESPGKQIRAFEDVIEQRRRSGLLPRLSGLFVARRHRTPLLYFTGRTSLAGGMDG
jgi:hypothetical protein